MMDKISLDKAGWAGMCILYKMFSRFHHLSS